MNKQKSLKSRSSVVNSSQSNNNNTTKKSKRLRRSGIPKLRFQSPLSQCARDYLHALVDPFGYNVSNLPCVPDFSSMPSYKISTKIRGTFAVGANGFGYITYAPYSTSANDSSCGFFSNSSYTGTTVSDVTTLAGVFALTNGQFPYTTSTARPTRIVASGIRVRYIGTELNRGGQCVIVRSSSNFGGSATLIGADLADMLARQRTVTTSVDRNWHGATYLPMDMANNYASAPVGYGTAVEQLCIAVTGSPGNQFEFEIITYYEILPTVVGGVPRTVPTQTASHSDADGLSHIRDWLNSAIDTAMGSNAFNTALRTISAAMIARYRPGNPAIEWNL
jgi:hypothetical protein